MTIEQAVEAALKADAPIAARVAERVYFSQRPERVTGEFIVHRPVSMPRLRAGNALLPFHRPRWEVTGWAARADDALEIARLVRDLFDGYSGTLGGAGGVTVRQAVYEDSRLYQDPTTGLWGCPVEVYLLHQE